MVHVNVIVFVFKVTGEITAMEHSDVEQIGLISDFDPSAKQREICQDEDKLPNYEQVPADPTPEIVKYLSFMHYQFCL